MRLHVLSDLHLEFGAFQYSNQMADCVILAGDVHTKKNGIKWIKENITEIPVIYIMGNHEFYGEKFPRLIDKIKKEAEDTNVHVLENEHTEIDEYLFFGCTLWTNMNLYGDFQSGSIESQQMNDYKRIRKSAGYKKLQPRDTRIHHSESVLEMEKFFASHSNDRTVVVTHHAPSILSLPENRRDQIISCAYASNLDSFVQEHAPLIWIHGHIHHSKDYRIGNTRILSNPRAYIDEPNPNFDPSLVVEI